MGNCLPNPKTIVLRAKMNKESPTAFFGRRKTALWSQIYTIYTIYTIHTIYGIAFEALFEMYCIEWVRCTRENISIYLVFTLVHNMVCIYIYSRPERRFSAAENAVGLSLLIFGP